MTPWECVKDDMDDALDRLRKCRTQAEIDDVSREFAELERRKTWWFVWYSALVVAIEFAVVWWGSTR